MNLSTQKPRIERGWAPHLTVPVQKTTSAGDRCPDTAAFDDIVMFCRKILPPAGLRKLASVVAKFYDAGGWR